MLTKEEYLKKIGETEESLKKKCLVLKFIGKTGYSDDEEDGWDLEYTDQCNTVEVGMGCKCAIGGTLHDKL